MKSLFSKRLFGDLKGTKAKKGIRKRYLLIFVLDICMKNGFYSAYGTLTDGSKKLIRFLTNHNHTNHLMYIVIETS